MDPYDELFINVLRDAFARGTSLDDVLRLASAHFGTSTPPKLPLMANLKRALGCRLQDVVFLGGLDVFGEDYGYGVADTHDQFDELVARWRERAMDENRRA